MEDNILKNNLKFLEAFKKLGIIEQIGVARILNVKVMREGARPDDGLPPMRPAEEWLPELFEAYEKLSRIRRRNLLKLMSKAVK